MMPLDSGDLLSVYNDRYQDFSMFCDEVVQRCSKDALIVERNPKVVYTVKNRIKDKESLLRKIGSSSREITSENLLKQISDIAGVRLVVLHPSQMDYIDQVINKNIDNGRWQFREKPKAYEGDLRYTKKWEEKGYEVLVKDSYYTSVHYIVEQVSDPDISVEIQVRTVLEELWGEVEHYSRYKKQSGSSKSDSTISNEMRVLSYIMSTGRAHLDLIFDN